MKRKPKRLSFVPWFASDFAGSTRGWPCCARLLYRELLDAQWDLGGLPPTPEELQRVANVESACWERGWPIVSEKFELCPDGKLRNTRLEEHRDHAVRISEGRSKAGKEGGMRSAEVRKQSQDDKPPF